MSPQEGNILTRRTFVERDGVTDKRMPIADFAIFLDSGENLHDVETTDLAERLRTSFEPYTDDGDDTHPRIIIIDFEIEKDGDDDIAITSPYLIDAGVVSVKKLIEDGVENDEVFLPYKESFRALSDKLLQTTFQQANSPDTLLWYEATPSQFLFIPPGESARVGEKVEIGGTMGTFILVDLDPRLVKVAHSGARFGEFSEKLEIQFILLTGESASLAGFTPNTSVSPDLFKSDVLQQPQFVEQFPISHTLLDKMLVGVAA